MSSGSIRLSARSLLVLLVICVVLTGCGVSGDGVGDPAASGTSAVIVDDIGTDAMGLAEKRALAEDFPYQVPVIAGEVVDASGFPEAGGGGLWEYVIQSGLDPAYVAEWYVRTYTVADWSLVERRDASAGGEILTFTKGAGAESFILVTGNPEGALVDAAIGIGVPVTATF